MIYLFIHRHFVLDHPKEILFVNKQIDKTNYEHTNKKK